MQGGTLDRMFAMKDVLFVGGLILCAILVLIPTVMIGYLIFGIISGLIEHRRDEARRVTLDIPGLGKVTTTDNRHWKGERDDISVCVDSAGSPPGDEHIGRIDAAFANLELLAVQARAFLEKRKETFLEWDNNASEMKPFAIQLDADGTMILDLAHPDLNGWYWIRFRNDMPIEAGYDD